MEKKSENFILFFLVIFSIYCSLNLGMTFDEPLHYQNGLNRLRYSLSLGRYEYHDILHLRYYPGFYDTLSAFVSQVFPKKYEVEIHHITNLFFSLSAIIGVTQITKILFNKKVSKIVFLILLLNPIFFGHISMNPKDPMVAFSNIWTTFFIIRYFQTQHIEERRKYFSTLIGIVIGFGIGIRVFFLATVLPIIVLFLIEIYFLRIVKNKNFSLIIFFKDFIKIFLIAYFIMIIFWPNVHSNIFILPFKLTFNSLYDFTQGTPWGLLNGEFYRTINTPKLYLLVNFFYKLPEYILFTYLIFIFLVLKDRNFFKNHFKLFNLKILSLIFIIIYPFIVSFIMPLKTFDGLRYYLFLIPYLCIIPGITFYYLIYHSNLFLNKLLMFFLFISFSYFLFNFFSLTPYHYTYLNIFNGKFSEASNKFENDYWGSSIKELVNKIKKSDKFENGKNYRIAFCGINYNIGSYYLENIKKFQFIKSSKDDDYDFIIMTNRHNGKDFDKKNEVKTCFNSYKGEDVLSVRRNGLLLSTIRKK